jgi:hypothetical protein
MIIKMEHWFPNFEPKHHCPTHQSRGGARHMLGGTHTKDVNLLFIVYLIMYLAIEHINPSPPQPVAKRKEKKTNIVLMDMAFLSSKHYISTS